MIVMNRRRSMRGLGDDLVGGDLAQSALLQTTTDATSARHAMFSPETMRRMRSPEVLAPITSVSRERILRSLRTNVSPGGTESPAECECLVNKLSAHAAEIGSPLTAANLAQAQAMCAVDPVQFQRVMVEGMGIALGFRDLDPCRPWYMRRTVWGFAAVLGVIGITSALVLGRRRR